MSPEDKRLSDSAPSTLWASDNLVRLLGLFCKDLKDLTDTAHALQLWQEFMASQSLLPAHLSKPQVGIVNKPVAASSGPAGNGTVNGDNVDSHQGKSLQQGPLFLSPSEK